jgi:hypothetical protein
LCVWIRESKISSFIGDQVDKVIVRIPKGGSLQVTGLIDPKQLYKRVKEILEKDAELNPGMFVYEVRRGPKKRQPASGDSEAEGGD